MELEMTVETVPASPTCPVSEAEATATLWEAIRLMNLPPTSPKMDAQIKARYKQALADCGPYSYNMGQ